MGLNVLRMVALWLGFLPVISVFSGPPNSLQFTPFRQEQSIFPRFKDKLRKLKKSEGRSFEDLIAPEVNRLLRDPQHPIYGLVVAVVPRDSLEFIKGYGRKSLRGPIEAPTATSYFEVASLTKVFAGLLLGQSQLRSKLNWNEALYPHEFCGPTTVSATCFRGDASTWLDLVTHTSALPTNPAHQGQNPKDPFGDFFRKDFMKYLQDFQLSRAPGERWEYSAVGYGLLGNLLAAHFKAPTFAKLLQQEILDPMGLEDSFFLSSDPRESELVPAHLDGKATPHWSVHEDSALQAADGMRSNAKDLVRFLRHQMGSLLVDGPIDAELKQAILLSHNQYQGDSQYGMGLGWSLDFNRKIIWKNASTFGHRSFMGLRQDKKLGVVILSNSVYFSDVEADDTRIDELGYMILQSLGDESR